MKDDIAAYLKEQGRAYIDVGSVKDGDEIFCYDVAVKAAREGLGRAIGPQR